MIKLAFNSFNSFLNSSIKLILSCLDNSGMTIVVKSDIPAEFISTMLVLSYQENPGYEESINFYDTSTDIYDLTKLDEYTYQITVKPFIDYRYFEKFIKERLNRNALTTDRETAIMFGLPPSLIEGIFVGRILEKDKDALAYIKSKLPDCYICNLDGKVIIGN